MLNLDPPLPQLGKHSKVNWFYRILLGLLYLFFQSKGQEMGYKCRIYLVLFLEPQLCLMNHCFPNSYAFLTGVTSTLRMVSLCKYRELQMGTSSK